VSNLRPEEAKAPIQEEGEKKERIVSSHGGGEGRDHLFLKKEAPPSKAPGGGVVQEKEGTGLGGGGRNIGSPVGGRNVSGQG